MKRSEAIQAGREQGLSDTVALQLWTLQRDQEQWWEYEPYNGFIITRTEAGNLQAIHESYDGSTSYPCYRECETFAVLHWLIDSWLEKQHGL